MHQDLQLPSEFNDQTYLSAQLTSALVTLCAAFDIQLVEMSMARDGALRVCILPNAYKVPVTIEALTAGSLWDAVVRLAGQIRGVYA